MSPEAARPRRTPGRKRDPGVDRRVMDTVRALVAARGVGGVTVSDIARSAAVGKPSIYLRWPNTQAVIVAAIRDLALPVAPPPALPLEEALTAVLEEDHLQVVRGSHGPFLHQALRAGAERREIGDALAAHVLGPRHDRLLAMLAPVADGVAQGPAGHAARAADLLHASLVADLVLMRRELADGEPAALVAVVLGGIGTDGGRAAPDPGGRAPA